MRRASKASALAGAALAACAAAAAPESDTGTNPPGLSPRAVLTTPAGATSEALRRFRRAGADSVVVNLAEGEGPAVRKAGERARKAGLALYYWVEVARNPALADARPQWMASLQGHPEWRRLFPGVPQPAAGGVVKNYPWVPVVYREAFEAHLRRVERLLGGLPAPRGIFLNDLQAAPSACGCGNAFCRWTADYGPIRTATELPADAAARFVAAVRRLSPAAEVIPVWTTECEEYESALGEACHGVPCFRGACWNAWTEQLMPVARESPLLAVLAPYRAFNRDHPRYGPTAGWVKTAVGAFAALPPLRKGTPVPAGRLIPVLQGWDVTPEQRRAQLDRAQEAGARGYVMSEMKIEQGWKPRIIKAVPLGKAAPSPPAGHAPTSH